MKNLHGFTAFILPEILITIGDTTIELYVGVK